MDRTCVEQCEVAAPCKLPDGWPPVPAPVPPVGG